MKINEDALLLALVDALDDNKRVKRTFGTLSCFNIVNLVYEISEEDRINEGIEDDENDEDIKKYMDKIGSLNTTSQPILAATVSMIKSVYMEKYKDKILNMVVNIAPHKAALISTAYRVDEDDEELYMNRPLSNPAAVGAMVYSKDELDRLSLIYENMKLFIKDVDNHLSIPKEETVTDITVNDCIDEAIRKYKEIKHYIFNGTDILSMFGFAMDGKELDDLDDFIALLCALYVDNFIYMLTTLPNLKESLANVEKSPYSSSLTILEVEDPELKENYKDLYDILAKYKLLALRLTAPVNQVMEQMFATIIHAFIMNMLYEYENNITKLGIDLELDKLGYYTCCQLIKMQMGFEALLKEDIAYNIGSLPDEVIEEVYERNNKNKADVSNLSAKLKSTGTTLDNEPPKYYN